METFETVVVFESKSKEEIQLAEISKFRDVIQSINKTKKVKTEDMGVKNLAYPIKDNTEGHYAIFTYQARPTDIVEIERQLRIDDHVLKFVTIKHEESEELEDYYIEEPLPSEQSNRVNALDILIPDTHLTNDEKYDIIRLAKNERRWSNYV